MGPDIGPEGEDEASMEVSRGMDDERATQGRTDCPLQSASNVEESENMDVDINGCTNNCCDGGPKNECNASTGENSSSFGDTLSGTDYGSLLGDEEVESQSYGTGSDLVYNGYKEAFPRRKKKLTVHWRKFISPLMWRCRWLELQIKKLQSQKSKYDKELALCDQRRQSDYENFSMEGFDVKSLGFSSQAPRNKPMKRKKRKKTEETSDLAAYMTHHNLFSYYEKKRSLADMFLEDNIHKLDKTNTTPDDILDVFGTKTNEGWPFSTVGDDNDIIMENIFSKIEAAQSKLLNLKDRIYKVVDEIPMNFSSINELNLLTSPDDPEEGNGMLVRSLHEASRHMSEREFGDVLMPETAMKSHEEVVLLPDKIETTAVGLSCGSSGKGLLQRELPFPKKSIPPAPVSQADFTSKNTEPKHKAKSLSAVGSNISKRGRRRRAGSNKRNRRATG